MENTLLSYVVTLFSGAAIPMINNWLNKIEKEKYFKLEVKEKLKLVAVEKRLEAHQKAFSKWYDLLEVIHKPDHDPGKLAIINDATEFWKSNSIYLERNTRNDFREAIFIVSSYSIFLLAARQEQDPVQKKKDIAYYKNEWEIFMKVPETIQLEVELEPIKPVVDIDFEGKKIMKKQNLKTP